MSYYWFIKRELLKKAAKYYLDNKDVLKEKAKNEYRNLPGEEKEVKRLYSENRYNKLKEKSS